MTLGRATRCLCVLLAAASLAACATRSHIRGCDLTHPYHEARVPGELVVAKDMQKPRTKATFHVPDQKFLAPKPDDLVTAEHVETLNKEELKAKRCIVAPPRLPAADAEPAAA